MTQKPVPNRPTPSPRILTLSLTLLLSLALTPELAGEAGPTQPASTEPPPPTALAVLTQSQPDALAGLSEAERDLLSVISYEDLTAYLDGKPAAEIGLLSGESLESYLGRQEVKPRMGEMKLLTATVGAGGAVAEGGEFRLVSSLTDREAPVLSGGVFSLRGGFVPQVAPALSPCGATAGLFCNGFETGGFGDWSVTSEP